MADLIGYIALSITVFALVRRDSKQLLLLISVGVFLWGVHYGLLGSTAGAIIHFIAGIGIFLAHISQNATLRQRLVLAGTFMLLGAIGALYSGFTIENVLAAIGGSILTLSQYVLRGKQMRQGFIAGELVLFGFAFLVGSVPGMLVTMANVGAGVVGLWRLASARSARVASQC